MYVTINRFLVREFLKNLMKKLFVTFLVTFFAVSVFSAPLLTFAVDRTEPFSPGDTLDPGAEGVEPCGPSDDNCFVSINEVEGHFTVTGGGVRTTGKATAVLTGSIDPAASTTVTGVGTLFATELIVGDRITVSGETRTVVDIDSNTSLTVDPAFSDNANDASPDVLYAIFVARDSSGSPRLVVNDLGRVGVGTEDTGLVSEFTVDGSILTRGGGEYLKSIYWNGAAWERLDANIPGFVYRKYDTDLLEFGTFSEGALGTSATKNTALMFNTSTNNIGVNKDDPVTQLDIDGNVRTTGKASAVLTGSIDPAASTTVTGVGTLFTTELVVGDRITVTGETRTVTAISSDTALTVDSAFSDNANDASPDVLYALYTARDSSNNLKFLVNDQGNMQLGADLSFESNWPAIGLNYNANNDTYLVADSASLIQHNYTIDGLAFYTYAAGSAGANVSGGLRMFIDAEGDVGINMNDPSVELDVTGDIEYTGIITDVSDERLKENILTISGRDALSIISSLQAKSFNMIGNSVREYGFIAQEVQEIFSDAVSIVDPGQGYLGLNYISFIPLATESIKELNLNIESIALTDEDNSEESFADRFFNRMKVWFADSLNGIGDFFAGRVRTKELCLSDETGETCITKKELDELLEESDVEVIIGVPEIIISSPVEETEEPVEEVVEEVPEATEEETVEEPIEEVTESAPEQEAEEETVEAVETPVESAPVE